MRLYPCAFSALPSLLVVVTCLPRMAFAELSLVQYPPGTGVRLPAPNVVLSLDDSGSMGVTNSNGGSNMIELKTALHAIFGADSGVIPDKAIRLGWNTMNRCRPIPTVSARVGCSPVRVLDTAHRNFFLNWVGDSKVTDDTSKLSANGMTPTHDTYMKAGDYFEEAKIDRDGPWAEVPGTKLGTVLSCRRNYVILMTDGEWSGAALMKGGGKNTARTTTMPDKKNVYSGTSDETRLYRNASETTLADLAFYYWATDLLPGHGNDVIPVIRRTGSELFKSGSRSMTLTEYWNPKNNPSTWQNVTTYTIGFGEAATWTGNPKWGPVGKNDTYGGDFPALVTGAMTWPSPTTNGDTRKMELWHMALAGRGRFIPATSADHLVKGFKEIFGAIIEDTSAPVTSYTNSGGTVSRETMRFTARYEANGWLGYLIADTLAKQTAAATPAAGWGTKAATPTTPPNLTTADKLDALSAADLTKRLILTWSDTANDPGGASFQWTAEASPKVRALSTGQKTLLKTTGTGTVDDAEGSRRLDFIRGDRSQESAGMRVRRSRQGDIVNSTPWYVAEPVSGYGFQGYLKFAGQHAKRLPMVYVGGNDGMLHGFSGVDGTEKIAYVPKGVIQNLAELTSQAYKHRYYVDGSPFSGDVNWGDSAQPNWRTLLVGTLGAGGKGYFVLDVTNPGSTATDSTKIESDMLKTNADKLVVLDATAAAGSSTGDADIGHIMVAPVLEDGNPQKTTQIVRMNDGRWALVMGNGINSRNAKPVLLIQYLDGDKTLHKIPLAVTGANATDNGLSAPRLVDIDGNGTPDVIYAGDLRGNLWKFNVMSATASEWTVGFGTTAAPLPLYTASHGSAKTPQPITAAPLVRTNDRGVVGLMVAFGTGLNVTEADRASEAVQTIYSVLDNTRYKLNASKKVVVDSTVTPAVVSGISELVEQTVGTTAIAGSGDAITRKFSTTSTNSVPFDGKSAKKGWYLNLPEKGERVLAQMRFYDGSNNIELMTQVPGKGGGENCAPTTTTAEQTNFRTFLNIVDGKPPTLPLMDLNGDGVYKLDSDKGVSRSTAPPAESHVSTPTNELRIGSDGVTQKFAKMPMIPLRPSWRQVQ